MNKQRKNESAGYLKQRILITFMFFILVIVLESITANYFITLLNTKAQITARALVWSRELALVEVLEPAEGEVRINQVIRILQDMLLLKDRKTGSNFILGVKLEVDYDVVKAKEGTLDLEIGEVGGKNSFVTKIEIYSKTTKELMATATFYNPKESFQYFKKEVKGKFFVGVFYFFILLVIVWFTLTRLFGKIKKTERELQEKQSELAHAGILKAMGDMAAGIAHELNQPLQVIGYAADNLNDFFSKTDRQSIEAEAARDILSEANRAVAIINNMRFFLGKRSESAKLKPVDLREPLERAISFFKEQFKVHDISLDVYIDKDLPRIKINPQEFMQIVVNLLSNSRDAVDRKGEELGRNYKKEVKVHLSRHQERDEIVFMVQDNGIGMEPEVKEKCMEPFYTTKDVGEGTGLGLFIIYSITRKFGMSTEIDSIKPKGSTFRILIPIKE